MELFVHCEREPDRMLAITEDGQTLTLGDLNVAAERLSMCVGGHRLVFLLCENTPGTLLGYLSCLKTGVVPLLLDAHISPDMLLRLRKIYRPAFFYAPKDLPKETRAVLADCHPVLALCGSVLLCANSSGPDLHPDLALLLTTSGSTGSPKLVRLTGKNLDANARSIVEYLGLTEQERPILNLPIHYSYGMSIVHTHLLAGATVVLTRRSVLERSFWDQMVQQKVTSLASVPYTCQMLQRAGLTEMKMPCLHTLTQAGGKLPEALHRSFAQWAQDTGRRFFVMYGQTEAAPRMGYLPPERALDKCGSMGIAIPGGTFRLEDEAGASIDGSDTVGELVYYGANVAMGYAQTMRDLVLGDEWQGRLSTGDMAKRDADGFYYITGRKKRFIKIYGNRVSLDEVERLLSTHFPGINFACVGKDDSLTIFHDSPNAVDNQAVVDCLRIHTRIPRRAFAVAVLDRLPRNEAGKILYAALKND